MIVVVGRVVRKPIGTKCDTHKLLSAAWPLVPWEMFAKLYKTNQDFKVAVDKAALRVKPSSDTLPDQGVDSMTRQGLRIELPVLIYSVEEFIRVMKTTPEALRIDTAEITNEFAEQEKVVILIDDGVRKGMLYCDTSLQLRENCVTSYVRPGQANDTFQSMARTVVRDVFPLIWFGVGVVLISPHCQTNLFKDIFRRSFGLSQFETKSTVKYKVVAGVGVTLRS